MATANWTYSSGVNNSDGKTSSLAAFLGNGDGTFASPTFFSLGTGLNPIIAVGDFNGDHNPDVAVVFSNDFLDGSGGSSMLVLLGDGKGGFETPVTYYAGLQETWLAVADFNGDGKLDVAVSGSSGIAVLLGKGDGTFQTATFAGNNSYNFVGAGDLNGDGKLDLITTTFVSPCLVCAQLDLQVLLGNGDGTFQTLPQFDGLDAEAIGGTSIVMADIDGDGKLDLVAGQFGADDIALVVYPGNGDGTFANAVTLRLPESLAGPAGNFVNPVAADFNSDGKPDIAIGTGSSWVPLFYNTTQPDFQISAGELSPASVTPGNSASSTITLAPLNGFNSAVTLSCSGLPSGAGCSFNPTAVPAGSNTSTLTLTTSSTTPAGTYPVSITGASGSLNHSTSVSLVVQLPLDFAISASALSPASVSAGGSATSTITIGPSGGFSQSVTLSCSGITLNGWPANSAPPSCAFNPSTISKGSGTSTLTVSTMGGNASLAAPWLRRSGLFYALWLPVAGMALLGGFGSRRKKVGFLLVLLALSGLMFLAACGGGGGNNRGGGGGGTPAGTYTMKITGTAGSTAHSTTVTLAVQ